MKIDDELLDWLGNYYSSEYVGKHQPWLREMTFISFVQVFLSWRMPQQQHFKGMKP